MSGELYAVALCTRPRQIAICLVRHNGRNRAELARLRALLPIAHVPLCGLHRALWSTPGASRDRGVGHGVTVEPLSA